MTLNDENSCHSCFEICNKGMQSVIPDQFQTLKVKYPLGNVNYCRNFFQSFGFKVFKEAQEITVFPNNEENLDIVLNPRITVPLSKEGNLEGIEKLKQEIVSILEKMKEENQAMEHIVDFYLLTIDSENKGD